MTFYIRYGLGGGFGGSHEWEKVEALSLENAEECAYELACEEYESYGGMHGLRSVSDIMEEEGINDEEEAEMVYNDERESWLVYEARLVKIFPKSGVLV